MEVGGGGYPAAGIGGGGAGGGGGTCCAGAGGYSGGASESNTAGIFIPGGVNGKAGSYQNTTLQQYWEPGGGYFEGAEGIDTNGIDRKTTCLGGFVGGGWDIGHQGGSGGIAGTGGNVKVSSIANIYAYNGNRYTDGTSYNNGDNQVKVYAQNGIINEVYKYIDLQAKSFKLEKVSNSSTVLKSGYINSKYDTSDEMKYQGVGSGAGYTEKSNGTYTVASEYNTY